MKGRTLLVFLKLTFLKPITSNLKFSVKLHGYKYLAILTSLFICRSIVSCRHSATTKANDNGTSKDHEGNEINQAGSDTTSCKVATIVLVLVVLQLVLFGIIIIFKKARKRRRGNYFIWNFHFSSLGSIEFLLRNIFLHCTLRIRLIIFLIQFSNIWEGFLKQKSSNLMDLRKL